MELEKWLKQTYGGSLLEWHKEHESLVCWTRELDEVLQQLGLELVEDGEAMKEGEIKEIKAHFLKENGEVKEEKKLILSIILRCYDPKTDRFYNLPCSIWKHEQIKEVLNKHVIGDTITVTGKVKEKQFFLPQRPFDTGFRHYVSVKVQQLSSPSSKTSMNSVRLKGILLKSSQNPCLAKIASTKEDDSQKETVHLLLPPHARRGKIGERVEIEGSLITRPKSFYYAGEPTILVRAEQVHYA